MLQMIEGEKDINVIGNAYVDEEVKNITPADIISSISYFFNLFMELEIQMILTI